MNNKWKSTLERLPHLAIYFLALSVVVFISFLFPDHVRFKYHFERGQTWHYEDLVAPFDFAIIKTDEELRAERESVREQFSPFYRRLSNLEQTQTAAFEQAFAQQLEMARQRDEFQEVTRAPAPYLQMGRAFLARAYQRGVIEMPPAHEERGEDVVVNVIDGNTSRRHTVGQFLTVKQARERLSDTLFNANIRGAEFLYPLLEMSLRPNIVHDDTLSRKFLEEALALVSTARGMVKQGEMIIPKDGIVTDEAYQKLSSLKEQYERELLSSRSKLNIFLGYFLLTSLIVGLLVLYVASHARSVFHSVPNMLFLFLWLVVYSYAVYAVERTNVLSAYLVPFCILPIVVKTFFTVRLAFFTHVIVVLIGSFLTTLGYEFALMHILAGVVVVLNKFDTRDWSKFFYSMLFIFLVYATSYLGLSLIQSGDIYLTDWSVYSWLSLNVFLTLLAYPLIPLLERVFGFTSSITLMELSDMNRPLLRELAIKAPGTLQHSLQVANLSEAAARRIGANELLVKVAALYHDIGKTVKPEYFIENQGENNPHENLSHQQSARIIIDHVKEGEKLARKYRLPKLLIDFIRTHHGTTRVEYFYRNFVKENPNVEVDEALFRYPGPRPRTREETIMMLADSIEAACKSLRAPTEEQINELIDKIIDGKIAHAQLVDSMMTFQELEDCREVFKQKMKSVYHSRIVYPEEQKTDEELERANPKAG
jgi:putative nucleotidyltransferase with HDIG domain